MAGNSNKAELENTVQDIHDLTVNLYTANRLKINSDKSQILQVENNLSDVSDPNRQIISIRDLKGKEIKAKTQMKSKMGIVYAKMKPFLSFMNVPDCKIIVGAKLKSILDYGVPLFQGENQMTMNKLEASYMTINRIIRRGLTYKVSRVKICNDIKCDLPAKHIRKASLSFIHKHLTHRKCSALMDQLMIPKGKSSPIFVSLKTGSITDH